MGQSTKKAGRSERSPMVTHLVEMDGRESMHMISQNYLSASRNWTHLDCEGTGSSKAGSDAPCGVSDMSNH